MAARTPLTTIRQHLADQAASPLSVAAYCRQQDLKPASFYRWRRSYAPAPPQHEASRRPDPGPGFCQLSASVTGAAVASPTTVAFEADCHLVLPGGLRLGLAGLSTEQLAALLLTLDRHYRPAAHA